MKTAHQTIIRSIVAILLGLMLVLWPAQSLKYLVITLGVLFLGVGVIALIGYLGDRKDPAVRVVFPLSAIASVLLGLMLVIGPDFFTRLFMYLIIALVILGAAQQIFMLLAVRKWTSVSFWHFLPSILLLVLAVILLFKPLSLPETLLLLLGICALLYGISELFHLHKYNKKGVVSIPQESSH